MSKPFSQGGVIQLPKHRYGVSLTWNKGKSTVDLDLQALVVDDTGVIVDAVYYKRLEAMGRAISHTGDDEQNTDNSTGEETVWVNLNKVKNVKLIVFMVACHSGGKLGQAVDAKVQLVEQWHGQMKECVPVSHSGGIHVMLVMNRGDDGSWTMVKVGSVGVEGNHFMDILEPKVGDIIRRRIKGAPKQQRLAFKMSKGSHQDLPSGRQVKRIAVGVGWDMSGQSIDLDVSAVLFGDVGQKVGAVFYNNTNAFGLHHTGDNETGEGEGDDETILVDLGQVPEAVHQIFFIVNVYTKSHTFNMLKGAYCRVSTNTGAELMKYDFQPSSCRGSGLLLARMFRNPKCGRWGFQAVGTFCEGRKWMDRSCLKEMQRVFYIAPEALVGVPDLAPVTPRVSARTPRSSGKKDSAAAAEAAVRPAQQASFDLKSAACRSDDQSSFFFGSHASTMEHVSVGVGWDALTNKQGNKLNVDLDVAAVFFHSEGRDVGAVDGENVQEFGLKHSGDNTTGEGDGDDEVIDVSLLDVPEDVTQIFFVVTVFTKGITFSKVGNAYCRVCGQDGQELVRHELSEVQEEELNTGLVIAQIFKLPSLGWFFKPRSKFLAVRTWMDPQSIALMKDMFAEVVKGEQPVATSPRTPRGSLLRGASKERILGQNSLCTADAADAAMSSIPSRAFLLLNSEDPYGYGEDSGKAGAKDAGQQQACACGNIFMADSSFCRMCGAKRPMPIEGELERKLVVAKADTILTRIISL